MHNKIISLRMERQHLIDKANEEEYLALYRDTQPGQNVYWNGFGDPPSISFRADFDDIEFNRSRQEKRELLKGRFVGGNLGWITPEDLELFVALYRKPLTKINEKQEYILKLINSEGPLNIQQIKEISGMLVKEITPVLHRLQEAFLIYEDQYDGEWDRAWYRFEEMFPDVDFQKYSLVEALKIVIKRFAYRNVIIDENMVKSFYKLPVKAIKSAIDELLTQEVLVKYEDMFILKTDLEVLENYQAKEMSFVYALHRNDFLYKSNEHILKEKFTHLTDKLPYDHDFLQYLLIDGEIRGATVGHFRNGPYDLNDVVLDLPIETANLRKNEIIKAISSVNYGKVPVRFMGEEKL